MIRTNIFLSEEQRNRLAALSESTGVTAAEHVRRAINQYLSLHDGALAEVLTEAYHAFPDVEGDDMQALTRALFHWLHGRQDNSKRGALGRVEKKQDKALEYLGIILEMMTNDTDHG